MKADRPLDGEHAKIPGNLLPERRVAGQNQQHEQGNPDRYGKELGIVLTEADFVQPDGELDDDELDNVAGGDTGWRGTRVRCVCILGDHGDDW